MLAELCGLFCRQPEPVQILIVHILTCLLEMTGWHSGDREVAGSTPARVLLHNNLRQVVHTLVPLPPSCISGYQLRNWEGNDRSWKRCSLPSFTLSVSSLLSQNHQNGDKCRVSCETALLTNGPIYCFYSTWMMELSSFTNKCVKNVVRDSVCSEWLFSD